VLARGDEDYAAHVTALLGAWLLILSVDTNSTEFDEHIRELHCSRQATLACVGVGYDGFQVIHGRAFLALFWRHATALLAVPAIVEELGTEGLADLVRNGVIWVIRRIGAKFI
jgi:hypothetical protein